jgi:isopentenyl diphosphate isomerase/L-lactate dehydrogenase-like FMN-dependent dehydrogenase
VSSENDVPFSAYQLEVYLRGLSGERPELPVVHSALDEAAREAMSPEAYAYVAGAAGSERTLRDNERAFDRWRLVPRMLRGALTRDLSTEVLGTQLRAPVMLAPVGVLSIIHEDAEPAAARAAAAAGIGKTLSTVATTPIEEVAAALGDAPRWYQLYPPTDPELGRSLISRAEEAGFSAIVVTLDSLTMPWRPRDIETAYLPFVQGYGIANYTSDPVFQAGLEKSPEEDMQAAIQHWIAMYPNAGLTWDDLDYVRESTELPVVLKGILHPADAREASERGYDGVVVSNHGGRQVDGSIPSLEALPEIVAAVPDEFTVLFDSGIRTGADIVKAIALGASAVLVGRPWVWGLALGGEAGATAVLRGLLADLDLSMAMWGLRSIEEIDADVLVHAPTGA